MLRESFGKICLTEWLNSEPCPTLKGAGGTSPYREYIPHALHPACLLAPNHLPRCQKYPMIWLVWCTQECIMASKFIFECAWKHTKFQQLVPHTVTFLAGDGTEHWRQAVWMTWVTQWSNRTRAGTSLWRDWLHVCDASGPFSAQESRIQRLRHQKINSDRKSPWDSKWDTKNDRPQSLEWRQALLGTIMVKWGIEEKKGHVNVYRFGAEIQQAELHRIRKDCLQA